MGPSSGPRIFVHLDLDGGVLVPIQISALVASSTLRQLVHHASESPGEVELFDGFDGMVVIQRPENTKGVTEIQTSLFHVASFLATLTNRFVDVEKVWKILVICVFRLDAV